MKKNEEIIVKRKASIFPVGFNTEIHKVIYKEIKKNLPLYTMLVIPLLYFLVFKYLPMLGVIVAFKEYNVFQGILASPWIGLENFREIFSSKEFYIALKNTLFLNIMQTIIGFPIPIILAILLNELVSEKLKKFTQTVIYLPHFFSWVIIAGIVYQIFSPTGIANNVLALFGVSQIPFLSNNSIWKLIYWGSGIWQGAGYGTILFLAAMGGINTDLYDAAYIDGAGRWRRIWYVTLPQLRTTIIIKLIMDIGRILNISFEKPYLLGNVLVKDSANVISTYVYNVGLQAGRYDFATAVGIFQSVVGLILVLSVNRLAKKMGEEGIA